MGLWNAVLRDRLILNEIALSLAGTLSRNFASVLGLQNICAAPWA